VGAETFPSPAVEQAGGIGHKRIWNWLHETGLMLEQAAEALGISRRMLTYYRDGEKSIHARSGWPAWAGKPYAPKNAACTSWTTGSSMSGWSFSTGTGSKKVPARKWII